MPGCQHSPLAFLDPRHIHCIPTENIKLIILENVVARADQGGRVWLQLPVKKQGEKIKTKVN